MGLCRQPQQHLCSAFPLSQFHTRAPFVFVFNANLFQRHVAGQMPSQEARDSYARLEQVYTEPLHTARRCQQLQRLRLEVCQLLAAMQLNQAGCATNIGCVAQPHAKAKPGMALLAPVLRPAG